jgi:hypothetical protein
MESAWTSTGHVVQWESMTHIKPLKDLVEPGWAQALADVEPQIHLMGDFLRSEIAAGRKYLPASRNILRAFTIPFDDIKVLIVGQDPYPTPGHPVGLSFCVAPDVKPIPRSLANIYTELKKFMEESVTDFIKNGVTDESYNTFVETAKAIGVERYIELYQNAYDAYLAK